MREEGEIGKLYIKRRHKRFEKVVMGGGSLGLLKVVANNVRPSGDPEA